MTKYLAARRTSVPPSDDAQFHLKFRKLTLATTAKWRFFTDNMLLNSGSLLLQWVLRTQTNPEDPQLQFLEAKRQQRMATEQEVELATDANESVDPAVGRLFLPDTCINSPPYWKRKHLDVHALVARKGPSTHFITVTMNPWREEMHLLGLDTDQKSAFAPVDGRPRVFDRPDLVARAYN